MNKFSKLEMGLLVVIGAAFFIAASPVKDLLLQGDMDGGGNSITNIVTGTGASNATTLGYVTNAITLSGTNYATSAQGATADSALQPDGDGSGLTSMTKSQVGLSNVDNTSDATKDAATATLTNKTLTSPVITTPTGIVKGDVGLGNVDNTSDAAKPVSTSGQTALDLKLDSSQASAFGLSLLDDADATAGRVTLGLGTLATQDGIFSGTSSGLNTGNQTLVGLGGVAAAGGTITSGTLAGTTINTGTISGGSFIGDGSALTSMTKAQVGLGSVDNTSDADKPVSTAGQTALDLKIDDSQATAFGLSLLDDADSTAGRVTLGLVIGTDVLAPAGDGSALTNIIWSQIGSTPTTISGYGITDAITVTSGTASVPTAGTAVTIVPSGTATHKDLNLVGTGAGEVQINGRSIILGGVLTTGAGVTISGAYSLAMTVTGATDITLPVTGTLATVSQVDAMLPLAGGTVTGSVLVDGNFTAGDAAGDILTINAGTVTTPNAYFRRTKAGLAWRAAKMSTYTNFTLTVTSFGTAQVVTFVDGADGSVLEGPLPPSEWAGKIIKIGMVVAVNGTSAGNLRLRFNLIYLTSAQLTGANALNGMISAARGTRLGDGVTGGDYAAPTSTTDPKLIESAAIAIPSTAAQIIVSVFPIRANGGDTNTDVLYVQEVRVTEQ